MSAPEYAVITLDLATARTSERIVEVGKPVDSIAVLALPVGVAVAVAFGENKPFVPLLTQGQSFDICPYATEGIFLSNALAAGFVSLLVSFGGLEVVAT